MVTRESILRRPDSERASLVDSYIRTQVARLPNGLHQTVVLKQTTRLKMIDHLKKYMEANGMDLEELQA